MDFDIFAETNNQYPLTLATLIKRPVERLPDKTGVVYRNPNTGRYFRFTWLQWYKRTCRLANVLKTFDIKAGKSEKPGDRVATMVLTHHRLLELYYGASCIGAVFHPIDARIPLESIVQLILRSEDKALFFDDIFLPQIEEIYDRIKDTIEVFVYISDKKGKLKTWMPNVLDYEDSLFYAFDEFDWPRLDEKTCAVMLDTINAAGLLKGRIYTHRALYLQALHQIAQDFASNDPTYIHMGESAVVLINSPFCHSQGRGLPDRYIAAANKLVFPGIFTVEGYYELVLSEKVTETVLLPSDRTMLAGH